MMPSGGELLFALGVLAALGWGLGKGVEAGCCYVGRHVVWVP